MSPRNPFVYGGPVGLDGFIGRRHEVNLLFGQITNAMRGSVAVVGERRIGKTSLLHYVAAPDVIRQWNLDETSSLFLFVDCGVIVPMTITRFWQEILIRMRREIDRRQRHPHLVVKITALLSATEIRTTEIEFLLEDLRDEGLLLVILLDEFEWVVRTDAEAEASTRELLGGLRALINHASRVLSLIVATRRPLDELCRDLRSMGSPFYNNFVYVHLRPFSQGEADSLLDQMLKNTGVVFSPEARSLIYELAGTHPLLLQSAAACLFDAQQEAESGALDRRLVLERFMDLTEHQWDDLWRWSTAGEQDVLARLARDAHEGAALLDERPGEHRNLLKRGLLVGEAGGYRLFSSTLRHYLLEQAAKRTGSAPGARSWARARSGSMVFISYCHKDEAEKEALLTHLRVLEKGAGIIEVWSDDQIGGGETWMATIDKAVLRARVAILLVTANFLSSDFVLRQEVPALLKRSELDGVRVIPVIAKACAWKTVGWLAAMNARPKNGLPVWGSGASQPDEALAAIASEVAAIVSDRQDAST
jgi:AAA+ ATPase superfamily predicted ATPase